MLHDELTSLAAPVLREVLNHPFWLGLRDGSLPGEALAYFVGQDLEHLLPTYARALARCAAAAPDDADTALFGQSAAATLEARDGLRAAYAKLAGEMDVPPQPPVPPPASPVTAGYASQFAASSTCSFHEGIGALLPMVWFNAEVSDMLKNHAAPGSRYLRWIEAYHPGESYRFAVQAFTDTADRAGESCARWQRQMITDQFSVSIHYEWAFADSCLNRALWPF
jgi:thiaminase (transcriptional activator TenA)